MKLQMAELFPQARQQLDRFRRQYLQLVDFHSVDFPSSRYLKDISFQAVLFSDVFADGALAYSPPYRYQLRVLKELIVRIERSMTDPDEVGLSSHTFEPIV